jgi:hypothetical protein
MIKRIGLALSLVVLGCGSSSDVPLDQLASTYAGAICAQNFKCCDASELAGKTMQTCVQNNQSAISLLSGAVSDAQSKGRASYDAKKMGDCITSLKAASCDEWKSGTGPTNQNACMAAITPKVANGGACQQSLECVSGNCVGAVQGDTPMDGMCQPADPVAAVGQSCLTATCADGAYCDDATLICKAVKGAGEACVSDSECANSCDTTTSKCTCYVGCGVAAPITTRSTLVSVALLGLVVAAARSGRGRRRRR